jgi:hypothetical protein
MEDTMTQEQIDELPDHLKKIQFENWHFYPNKKDKKLTLSDNFVDEVMRQLDIHFTPEITNVIPHGEGKLYVEAKVTVFNESSDYPRKTIAYASITQMPHADGQTHFSQLAITRALKTALIRHLQISDHDIELVTTAYGFTAKNVTQMTRNISDDEPATNEPKVVEPEIDLDLDV